ncbi:MAG: hypothetical protein ACLU4N_11190 [Butyricimonas faecihominis]
MGLRFRYRVVTDIYDIGQVTVLKDASAAVLYGDKAASGVILVERTKVTESSLA